MGEALGAMSQQLPLQLSSRADASTEFLRESLEPSLMRPRPAGQPEASAQRTAVAPKQRKRVLARVKRTLQAMLEDVDRNPDAWLHALSTRLLAKREHVEAKRGQLRKFRAHFQQRAREVGIGDTGPPPPSGAGDKRRDESKKTKTKKKKKKKKRARAKLDL